MQNHKYYILYFVTHQCTGFIFIRTVKMLHKTFCFTSWYVHILSTLSTWRWIRKEKELWIALCFPSLLDHHFQRKHLAHTAKLPKKGYDRVPRSFLFLWMPLPSFCVGSKVWFWWKGWPLVAAGTPAAVDVLIWNTAQDLGGPWFMGVRWHSKQVQGKCVTVAR